MARRSKVDRLPMAVQAEIGRLRERFTLDQIMDHLRLLGGEAAALSRSTLHRYISKVDEELADDLRRSRSVAAFLAQSLDDAPGSQALRLNVELLQDQILNVMRQAKAAQRAAANDGEERVMDSKGVMALAKALESLSRASRTDLAFQQDVERRIAERTRGEAAVAAEGAAKAAGMSAELTETIKRSILGVAA